MRTATNGNEEGEIETWLGDPKLAILLGGGWACFAASKNWRQDSGGNTGKNEEKRWLGSIDETDWRLSLLFASCWYFHGSLPAPLPPELQPIRASSALPPPLALWPDRPFDAGRDAGGMRGMHALSRRSAVTRESRPSVHADLCVGISPLGIWAGEGWLAGWQLLLGRWDSGAGQWTGAPESRASFPLSPSPPVPQVIVPWLLVMLFKIRRNPPFFPRACHDDCNRRGGVVALVRAGNTSRPSRSMVDPPTGPRRAEPQPTCWLSVPPRPIRAAHCSTSCDAPRAPPPTLISRPTCAIRLNKMRGGVLSEFLSLQCSQSHGDHAR